MTEMHVWHGAVSDVYVPLYRSSNCYCTCNSFGPDGLHGDRSVIILKYAAVGSKEGAITVR